MEREHGETLTILEKPRRAGDPAALIAGAEKIREILGWTPRYDDLDLIVRTSLSWERKLLEKQAVS